MSKPFREWRGRVNVLLYGLEWRGRWDTEMINYRVELLLRDRCSGCDPEDFYRAAVDALASGEELYDLGSCADGAAREALTGIVRRLDALRPWPSPPFVEQDVQLWQELREAPVVGRIRRLMKNIEAAFSLRAEPVGSGAARSDALVVLMRSGQLVALREKETLVGWVSDVHSTGDPAAIRAEIAAATGLTVDAP